MLCRCHCRGGVISLYQITIVNKENKKLHEKKCQTASAFIHKSFIHTFSANFKGQFRNDGYFLATGVKLSCIKLKRKSYTRWLVWLVKTQPVDFIKFLHPKTLKSYFIAGKLSYLLSHSCKTNKKKFKKPVIQIRISVFGMVALIKIF